MPSSADHIPSVSRRFAAVSIITFSLAVPLASGAAIALLAAPPGASASEGSVPSEVARYANDPDGLVARLDDLLGISASGTGIDFSLGTAIGQLNRVHTFTAAFVSGAAVDSPIELTNLWTAPIVIADKPVGLATIWINPATDAPDLADFRQDPDLAVAFADLPNDVALIYDEPADAWFWLKGSRLTTVVAGDSGVGGELPVAVYQRLIDERSQASQAAEEQHTEWLTRGPVIAGAIGVLTIVGVVIVLLLLLPARQKRRSRAQEPPPA